VVHILKFLYAAAVLFALTDDANAQACKGNLQKENNLSDVCDPSTARTNLGVGTGTLTSVTAGEGLTTTPGSFGGSITTTGTLSPVTQINAQTGTTYTVLNSDCGKLVTFSNGSAIAVTLPQAGAGSEFLNGCTINFTNLGVGRVTITPTTSTIDGLSTRTMERYQGFRLTSNGSNYISSGISPSVASDGLIDPDQLPVATTTITGGVRSGNCLEMGGTGNKTLSISQACRTVENRFGFPGAMSDSGASPKIPQYIATAMTIPANFDGSGCQSLTTATTANNVFTLKYRRSGVVNTIGTLTYTSSNTTTLSTQSAFNLLAGDVLYLEGPVTPDATLADLACTVTALRS